MIVRPPCRRAPRREGAAGATGRRGAVLVAVVLVLAVLGLLSTGLVFVSLEQARIVEARVAAIRARLAAESAARLVSSEWRTRLFRDLPVGAVRPVAGAAGALPGGARHEARVVRLVGGLYLVRAQGWMPRAGRPVARAGVDMLLRGLDPLELRSGLRAALTVGGRVRVGAPGRVDGRNPAAVPAPWPETVCPARREDEEGHSGDPDSRPGLLVPDPASARLDPGAQVDGLPPIAADAGLRSTTVFEGLGPVGPTELHALADRIETGTVAIGPRHRSGECDRGATGNWGAPLDPVGPCGDFFPLIVAPGDLELTAGAGQGVLVVDGDLRLDPAVRFYGVVLVGGRLLAPDGATLYGAVRAGSRSGASLWGGGTVAYRTCAIRRALRRSRGLNRPFRASSRWWLPAF